MTQPLATVLVVDDEPNNIEMLARRLQRHNYAVDAACSGQEALERLRSKAYDATLLDMMMPGLDGLGVLRRLRTQCVNANTPVIMVTARTNAEDVAEAFDHGADDFIAKPIDFRVLLARLKSQIARHQAQRHLEELNQRLNETVAARTRHLLDIESQLVNVAENLAAVLWRLEADDEGRLRLMFLHGAVSTVLGDAQPDVGEELHGILRLLHHEDADTVNRAMAELIRTGKPLATDVRMLVARGQRWLHLAARPSSSDHRRIDGILLDVNDRKHLEAQLLHTQKLESVGQLASGIAHEINSPAQYTRDNIVFVKESFGALLELVKAQDAALAAAAAALSREEQQRLGTLREAADLDFVLNEIPAALEQSVDGIDRISRIVNAMKGFTHPGGDEPESCDLNKLIEDTVTIARNEWKYVAELSLDLDPGMPFVSCFPGELAQVVLNLIVNAAHAIAEQREAGGPLGRIDVRSCYLADRHRVEIRVADDGPGVPESLRNRIFDPFFTTKPVGKGTGQGLAIARSVIHDKHKGTLTLDESVTRGATFVVSIPA
ncbi:MAG TPA: response regulator [Pseudomonadales bacterium]